MQHKTQYGTPGLSARFVLTAAILPLALAGCATTGSVKRAQATADQALTRAGEAGETAQHAQGSADAAMNAAQHAQTTADGASTAAQGAGSAAQQALSAGQGSDGRIRALESKISQLERWKAQQMRKAKKRHHHHHHHHKAAALAQPKTK